MVIEDQSHPVGCCVIVYEEGGNSAGISLRNSTPASPASEDEKEAEKHRENS